MKRIKFRRGFRISAYEHYDVDDLWDVETNMDRVIMDGSNLDSVLNLIDDRLLNQPESCMDITRDAIIRELRDEEC